VGWAASTRVAGAIAAVTATAVLGRQLGASEFGRLALVTSLGTAGGIVGSAGLNRLLLRDAARASGARESGAVARARFDATLAATPWVLLLSVPCAAVLTALLIAWLVPAASLPLSAGGGVLVALAALVLVGSDLLRGLGEVRVSNATSGRSGGVVVLGLLAGLLLVLEPHTAGGALACLVLATAVAVGLLSGALVRRRIALRRALGSTGSTDIRHRRPSDDDARSSMHQTRRDEEKGATWVPRVGRPWERSGSPGVRATVAASSAFAGIQLVLLAGSQADLWVAGGVLDDADVGAYAAAVRTMALVTLPLVTVQLASQPTVAHLAARGDRARLEHQVRRLAAGALVPSAVMLSACVAAPALVLRLLLGPGYEVGAPVLAVLALGQAVNVTAGLCGTVLTMSGQERVVLGVTGVGAVASVLAGLGGAVLGGPVGLAVAASLTTSVTYGALWWSCRRRLGIRTEPGWGPGALDGSRPSA
jgi:O-antigen/teichoic acid export membrane protein